MKSIAVGSAIPPPPCCGLSQGERQKNCESAGYAACSDTTLLCSPLTSRIEVGRPKGPVPGAFPHVGSAGRPPPQALTPSRKLMELANAFEPVQDRRIKSCASAYPARSSTPNNPVSRHSIAWRLGTYYSRLVAGPCHAALPRLHSRRTWPPHWRGQP
jgi:hypothetical protein